MELGNLMFNENNKNQKYECPDFVIALLKDIEKKISIIYWNKKHKDWESAFANTGNVYITEEFEVKAYSWDEDNDYNFKYKNIEISWYKYLGRDTTININPNDENFKKDIIAMYDDIISILKKKY